MEEGEEWGGEQEGLLGASWLLAFSVPPASPPTPHARHSPVFCGNPLLGTCTLPCSSIAKSVGMNHEVLDRYFSTRIAGRGGKTSGNRTDEETMTRVDSPEMDLAPMGLGHAAKVALSKGKVGGLCHRRCRADRTAAGGHRPLEPSLTPCTGGESSFRMALRRNVWSIFVRRSGDRGGGERRTGPHEVKSVCSPRAPSWGCEASSKQETFVPCDQIHVTKRGPTGAWERDLREQVTKCLLSHQENAKRQTTLDPQERLKGADG